MFVTFSLIILIQLCWETPRRALQKAARREPADKKIAITDKLSKGLRTHLFTISKSFYDYMKTSRLR